MLTPKLHSTDIAKISPFDLLYLLKPGGMAPFVNRYDRSPIYKMKTILSEDYVIASAEYAEFVLGTAMDNFSRPEKYKSLFRQYVDGDGGLLSQDAAKQGDWARRKRIVSKLFGTNVQKALHDELYSAGKRFAEKLRAHAGQLETGLSDLAGQWADDALNGYVFGRHTASKWGALAITGNGAQHQTDAVSVTAILSSILCGRYMNHKGAALRQRLNSHRQLASEMVDAVDRSEADGARGLIEHLVHAEDQGEQLSRNEILGLAVTMFMAGGENLRSALSTTLHELAKRPDIQRSLRDEVATICGDGPLEAHHLDDLSYCSSVVLEGLRMHAPTAFMIRSAKKDIETPFGFLPKGTLIYIPPYLIHRSWCNWNNPHVFDPERFGDKDSLFSKGYRFMPFLRGPHQCVAASMSIRALKICLVETVRGCALEHLPTRPLIAKFGLNLAFPADVHVGVSPLKGT